MPHQQLGHNGDYSKECRPIRKAANSRKSRKGCVDGNIKINFNKPRGRVAPGRGFRSKRIAKHGDGKGSKI